MAVVYTKRGYTFFPFIKTPQTQSKKPTITITSAFIKSMVRLQPS